MAFFSSKYLSLMELHSFTFFWLAMEMFLIQSKRAATVVVSVVISFFFSYKRLDEMLSNGREESKQRTCGAAFKNDRPGTAPSSV